MKFNSLLRPIAFGSALLMASSFAACVAGEDGDKGAEEEIIEDGKLDSFRSPIWHGPLQFGGTAGAELTSTERFHAWEFWLADESTVKLDTQKGTGSSKKVDTVLYLYKEGASGWGSYIGRNDDANGTVWSSLTKTLAYGHYRVLVKGYDNGTTGKFELVPNCDGEGCGPDTTTCGLGSTYHEFRDEVPFTTVSSSRITSVAGLTDLVRTQIVVAVQQSAHVDVTTAEEALMRVDQNEIFVTVRKAADGATYIAYEYGSGDNSYGAIFFDGTNGIAASIHDGDLYDCVVAGN